MTTSNPNRVRFVIKGEPASKANSRKLVTLKGRPASIKSDKARAYVRDAEWQIPKLPQLLEGELTMHIRIYYATQRPDLDESVILDVLQGKIYANDRQVRERHVYHAIDRANPRAEIIIEKRRAHG